MIRGPGCKIDQFGLGSLDDGELFFEQCKGEENACNILGALHVSVTPDNYARIAETEDLEKIQ